MKRYTFVLLSVFVCFTTIYSQSKSAIEFYDTTGNAPASRIGWTGDKDNGHFFIATPGEEGEIKVQNGNLEVNGTVKAEKFEGDGSGLTNLPCSSNGVTEINIANAVVNEDGELVFELSDGETIEAGVVRGADGAVGINWRGTWDNEKTYKKRDAVFYEGSSYYAADDDPAGVPGTDNSWSIIAKKGDKGEPGSGDTGSGTSVTGASINEDGKLVLELSNGSEITAGVVKGTDGVDGKDGEDGSDGTSIDTALIDNDGKLILKFSDGSSINAGAVRDSVLTDSSLAFENDNAVINVASTSPISGTTRIGPGTASFSEMGVSVNLSTSHINIGSQFSEVAISSGGIDAINRGSNDTTTITGSSIKTDTIKASEITVNGSPLTVPDYVFEDNYRLKSLNEVESFIKEHKHLPEVQSAKEIAENGMDVVKMNLDLLKKVEELTLYMLEQEKKMSKMEQEIKSLKNQK